MAAPQAKVARLFLEAHGAEALAEGFAKIIEQAEKLSEISDVLKASRDLNILHRLWKNDLGPVAKELREELWKRFQKASHTIHNRRQEFDKEFDSLLEKNLNKKNLTIQTKMKKKFLKSIEIN